MKKFLLIIPSHCLTYKVVFNLFQNHGMLCGFNDVFWFYHKGEKTHVTSYWVNTLGKCKPPYKLTDKYSDNEYQKFDNYDAINIPNIKNIPYDYEGVMGVSVHFMVHYNPNQFEIVKFRKGNDNKDLRINGKDLFAKVLIKKKVK